MRFCPHCGEELPPEAVVSKASKDKGSKGGSSFSDRMSYFLNPEGKEKPE